MLPGPVLAGILERHGPLRRCPPRVSGAELLAGLVFHAGQPRGTLGEHIGQLTGKTLSEPAASERRQTMPWEVFAAVLEAGLRPLADPARHPGAFYQGLRLVGVDGTQFSLANTPRVLGEMTKSASRRLGAAFAKLGCRVLVELGTRAPLACAVSAPGLEESEAALGLPPIKWTGRAQRLGC